MGKLTVYLLIVVWGIMVPFAAWLFFRVEVNDKALALEVKRNAAIRVEMRKELDELKAARKGEKGEQ